MEFFSNPSFAPFAISFYVLAVLFAIELLLLVAGLGGTSVLDGFLPDIPEPATDSVSLSAALYYFGFGKIPAVMFITMFAAFFTVSGLAIQSIAINFLDAGLPNWIAVTLSAFSTLFFTRPTSRMLGALLNSEKGMAISKAQLIGRVAEITDGTASHSTSAAAKVFDHSNRSHDIYVKSADEESIFVKGDKATIVSIVDGLYLVSHSE